MSVYLGVSGVIVSADEKSISTGFSSYGQPLPEQARRCNDSAVISIRDQGALDLIRFLLHQGHEVRIQVSGESMKPTLLGGETVQVSSLDGHVPRIGDILLLCDQQGNPLIHRVIRRYSCQGVRYVQTKGDACSCCDESVSLEQVLGRVTYILSPCEASATPDTGKRSVKDLDAFLMRLKSFLIVVWFISSYCLRRIGIVLRQ